MIYLALETVSIASYVMVGYMKGDRLSNEASLKYVLFGAISTGTMLFGMSLLYGLAGTLDLYGIRTALADQQMLVRIRPGAHGHHSHGPRRHRVQDGHRAVPFLVPGRLYRSSDPGDGVPVGGAESSGIRGAGALLLWRSGAAVWRRFLDHGGRGELAGDPHRCIRPHHDPRQRHRAPADELEAAPRLLQHRPRRLHPDGGGGPLGKGHPGDGGLRDHLSLHEPGRVPGAHRGAQRRSEASTSRTTRESGADRLFSPS